VHSGMYVKQKKGGGKFKTKKSHYREYSRVLEVVTQGGHDQCKVLDMRQSPVHRPVQ